MPRPQITVEQMERMSPQERADVVRAAVLRPEEYEAELSPEFFSEVMSRLADLDRRRLVNG